MQKYRGKMNRDAIKNKLRELATADTRTKAARLREVIDDVESAIAAGVTREIIVEELSRHGLTMTLATFNTTLKRIREQRGKTNKKTRATEQEQEEKLETQEKEGSHNPGDLDKIIRSTPNLAALEKISKRKKR